MSAERLYWARRAQELRFHQLEATRKQAESWRTGLTGLTGLFSAVLVIKGRDNLTSLSMPYSQLVAALFGLALLTLVLASLWAIRAASGTPGESCLLAGEDLQAWTREETSRATRRIGYARRSSLAGIVLVAVATGFAWFSPTQIAPNPLVAVDSTNSRYCGFLSGVSGGSMIIQIGGNYQVVPLDTVLTVRTEKSCP